MITETTKAQQVAAVPTCQDFDGDCEDICDKVKCWLHDPAKGACPYLGQGSSR